MSGLSILYMILISNSDYKNYYFFGYYIVVLVSNVFFRQSFVSCLYASFLFSLAFEYTVFATLGWSSLSFLNHWYFYSALIMLLVNSYSTELHRIYEFLLHQEVERNNSILTNTNEELDRLVAEKTKELQAAYQKEKKANLLQQTFLKNISHQIRTPLNSIIGISDSYLESNTSECDDKDLVQINNSGKDLLRMIDEIVLYSKIEAESLTINKTRFSLDSLISKSTNYFNEINKKVIKLKINTFSDKSYYIYSDFEKLLNILTSLIFDAYNRSVEGEIELICSVLNNSVILFKIIDNGDHLADDYITNVLSGQWLEDNKNIHSDEFGISLINKLSSYFGNGLKITNNKGKGNILSFDIDTPVESIVSHKATKNCIPNNNNDRKLLQGIKALVVEDIAINYLIIKRILEKNEVIVERAEDGVQAVAKASEADYDIILMDIQMPNMDGIEATKLIRSHGLTIPIIAQTANILAEDKYICLDAGCDDYIGKPINATELIDVILQYL